MTGILFRNYFFCLFISFIISQNLFGQAGTGLNFDGVNDHVTFASAFNAYGKELTVECWVKVTRTNTGSGMQQALWGQNSWVWMLHGISGSGFRFYLNFNRDGLMSPDIILDNNWHHLAATASTTNGLKVYVDGVHVSTVLPPRAQDGILTNSAAVLDMGRDVRYLAATWRSFSGSFDEVRIWNRELCQAEILHNMNKELDPTTQTGLKFYYKFSHGVADGTNTGVTTLSDLSGNGYNGTLNNFALTGTTSNWTTGNSFTETATLFSPSNLAGTADGTQTCISATVASPGLNFNNSTCQLLSRVSPSGASPVSGTINTCVTIDASVQSYNGMPYVQRHYDITPSTNPSTSTGSVTLYFTQQEFDAYNLARGSAPALPVSSTDVAGISQVRVTKYGGTGTAPGNYTGSVEVLDPEDSDVVWDATNQRWAVTVSVTGFSGFYLTSSSGTLPVRLYSFSGQKVPGAYKLNWKVATPDARLFTVQRSLDGRTFHDLGVLYAKASEDKYRYADATITRSTVYYRLKMEDLDGFITYSSILRMSGTDGLPFSVYPNPAKNYLVIQANDQQLGETVILADNTGRKVRSMVLNHSTEQLNLSGLSKGIYHIWLGRETRKIIID